MSDFSSRAPIEAEDSNCESDSNFENFENNVENKNEKSKRLKKRRQLDEMLNIDTMDDTESRLNFEETPARSTPFTSSISEINQNKMRRRLQFFFMNPIEKWQAKRRYVHNKFVSSLSLNWNIIDYIFPLFCFVL